MKNSKLKIKNYLFLIILGSLISPLVVSATSIYKANNIDICYEGLVPCGIGKPYWKNGKIVKGECDGTKVEEGIHCQFCHFFVMIDGIVDFVLFSIVLPVATLLLVIGGIMFYLYAENPEKVKDAKRLLTSVAIGLVIIFSAWLMVTTFFKFIGLAETGPLKELVTDPTKWAEIKCPIYLPK